jgi:DNA-binding transcriptional ArsR family regulator
VSPLRLAQYRHRVRAALRMKLPPGPKLVLVAVADHLDEGARAFPSTRRLAELTGYSERSVRRHMSTLAELGVVDRRTRQRPDGSHTTNMIVVPGLAEGEGTVAAPPDNLTPHEQVHAHVHETPAPDGTEVSLSPGGESPREGTSGCVCVEEQFERFKAAYPRRKNARQGWAAARRKFEALSGDERERAIQGAEAFAAFARGEGIEGTAYVPMARTWVNQREWEEWADRHGEQEQARRSRKTARFYG